MQFIAKACQKNYHLTSILFTFYLSHNNLEELKEEAINFTFEEKYFFANLQIFESFCGENDSVDVCSSGNLLCYYYLRI